MANIYEEFIKILQNEMEDAADKFNGPASEDELQELQDVIGTALPEKFIEFYKAADGEADSIGAILGFSLMPISSIIDEHEYISDCGDITSYKKGIIKEGSGNSKWIPFADDAGGSFFAIDLDPDTEGTVGQIITIDGNSGVSYVVAQSFEELLLHVIPEEMQKRNFGVGVAEDDFDEEFAHFSWIDGHYFDNIESRFQAD